MAFTVSENRYGLGTLFSASVSRQLLSSDVQDALRQSLTRSPVPDLAADQARGQFEPPLAAEEGTPAWLWAAALGTVVLVGVAAVRKLRKAKAR